MSPHANTPGTDVIQLASRHTLPRSVSLTPRSLSIPGRSAPRNPIASNTRSTSSVNSLPAIALKSIRPPSRTMSTFTAWSCLTRPSASPVNRWVETAYTRSPPSSWAPDTRKMFGHWGHGLSGARSSGGRGNSSNWWTDTAPWRWTVPRQSAPVSPPPMITTRLSRAVMKFSSGIGSPSQRRFWSLRYSIAKWMPRSSRPGTCRSRGQQAPPARTSASNSRRSSATRTLTPT